MAIDSVVSSISVVVESVVVESVVVESVVVESGVVESVVVESGADSVWAEESDITKIMFSFRELQKSTPNVVADESRSSKIEELIVFASTNSNESEISYGTSPNDVESASEAVVDIIPGSAYNISDIVNNSEGIREPKCPPKLGRRVIAGLPSVISIESMLRVKSLQEYVISEEGTQVPE